MALKTNTITETILKRSTITAQQVSDMIARLGITDADLVRKGVRTAMAFFADELHTDPFEWVKFIAGIDFHGEVDVVRLRSGTELVRYQDLEDYQRPTRPEGNEKPRPFYFYTNAGGSETRTGTNYRIHQYERYVVEVNVHALASRASGVGIMHWGTRLKDGGGIQYIISRDHAPQLHRKGQIYTDGRPGFRELQRVGGAPLNRFD